MLVRSNSRLHTRMCRNRNMRADEGRCQGYLKHPQPTGTQHPCRVAMRPGPGAQHCTLCGVFRGTMGDRRNPTVSSPPCGACTRCASPKVKQAQTFLEKLSCFRFFSERRKCFSVWLGRLKVKKKNPRKERKQVLAKPKVNVHNFFCTCSCLGNVFALSQLAEKTAFVAEAVSDGNTMFAGPAWPGQTDGCKHTGSRLVPGTVCA